MDLPALPVLGLREVADILDVTPATITQYRSDSRPGKRYAKHPFPAPSGHFGRSPWWAQERSQEIEEWADARPGTGNRANYEGKE